MAIKRYSRDGGSEDQTPHLFPGSCYPENNITHNGVCPSKLFNNLAISEPDKSQNVSSLTVVSTKDSHSDQLSNILRQRLPTEFDYMFRIEPSYGDGHCLIYSVVRSLNLQLSWVTSNEMIKDKIRAETINHIDIIIIKNSLWIHQLLTYSCRCVRILMLLITVLHLRICCL